MDERTTTGKTEEAIRAKGGVFIGKHGQNFCTVETLEVMQRQYGTSTYGQSLVAIADRVIAENAQVTAVAKPSERRQALEAEALADVLASVEPIERDYSNQDVPVAPASGLACRSGLYCSVALPCGSSLCHTPGGALCESGWTGDRCTFPLFHDGEHSNEVESYSTEQY